MLINSNSELETTKILFQSNIENPKVSIVIPVYNVAQYLSEALESVINQTLKEIEIICIDDCSTDNSLEILKKYAQKDNRITIIAQKINCGEVVAKYIGAQYSKANYIGTVDPDDFIEQEMYEVMYKKALRENSDAVFCNIKKVTEDKYPIRKIVRITNKNKTIVFKNKHIRKTNSGTTNKLIKKELFIRALNFTERDIWKDVYQYWRCFTFDDYKVTFINKSFYIYRIREGSITHSNFSIEEEWNSFYKTIDLLLNYMVTNRRYENNKKVFWIFVRKVVKDLSRNKDEYCQKVEAFYFLIQKYSLSDKDLEILTMNKILLKLISL